MECVPNEYNKHTFVGFCVCVCVGMYLGKFHTYRKMIRLSQSTLLPLLALELLLFYSRCVFIFYNFSVKYRFYIINWKKFFVNIFF